VGEAGRERERCLLGSRAGGVYYFRWTKAEKGSEESRKAPRSEGDDLEESALSRSLAMGGTDVVGGVKGIDELDVGVACRGARSRGYRRGKIEVDPKRRSLRQDVSDLVLETVVRALEHKKAPFWDG